MEVLPTALFLVPGAIGAVAHRFASAQRMASGTQLLLAVVYAAAAYGALSTPFASFLRTDSFPESLFAPGSTAIADPDTSTRLIALAMGAGLVGLLVGRLSSTQVVHGVVAWFTRRNLYSSVWIETFRGSPRQWVRLRSADLDLVGKIESASDDHEERALLLTDVHETVEGKAQRVVGGWTYARADAFSLVVFLGPSVQSAIKEASPQPKAGG